MPPTISVIMSVYNEPNLYIKKSVDSILNQTFSDFEFIIILDNPENKRIRSLLEAYLEKDTRVLLILNKKNRGLARSLNKGLSLARGEYIARMDADDISIKYRLEKQVDFLNKNPGISLVGSAAVTINEKGQTLNTITNPFHHQELLVHFLKGFTPCYHPTWLFRRKLLEELDGYRNLPVGQDYDFLGRALDCNFEISNIEEPLLKYREHIQKIGNQKNITQIILGEYIRYCFEKGTISNNKYFSRKILNRFSNIPQILVALHKHAQALSLKGRMYQEKNTVIYLSCLFFSGIISPFQFFYMVAVGIRSIRYKSWN